MSYIGRGLDKISNIEKLDTITFDGSSSYTLQKNSVNFTPNSANSLQVSIDGVVQAGNFTVSGSTIDFGVAIPSTSTCDFIFHYGTGLITTPADGTVGLAQLSATGTKDSTTFLRGDNTFAEAGGGKILQVVQGTLTTTASRASTSFGDTGLSVSITPSATSSKVLIMCTMLAGYDLSNQDRPRFKLLRDSTEIMGSDASSPGSRTTVVASVPRQDDGGGENMVNVNFQFLDSPSTTSAITYKTQYSTRAGNTAYINRMGTDTDDTAQCRGISVIQAIEVGA
jgi:hypothetical protein